VVTLVTANDPVFQICFYYPTATSNEKLYRHWNRIKASNCDYISHNKKDGAPYSSNNGVVLERVYVVEVYCYRCLMFFYMAVKGGLLI